MPVRSGELYPCAFSTKRVHFSKNVLSRPSSRGVLALRGVCDVAAVMCVCVVAAVACEQRWHVSAT